MKRSAPPGLTVRNSDCVPLKILPVRTGGWQHRTWGTITPARAWSGRQVPASLSRRVTPASAGFQLSMPGDGAGDTVASHLRPTPLCCSSASLVLDLLINIKKTMSEGVL